jgi:arylsulfatase A-like enzyme
MNPTMARETRLLRTSIFLSFFFAASLFVLSSKASASENSASRPNIVVIFIDALRPDKLGCYGFPAEISPEIDALAAQGVRFKTVIAQSTWTMPSIGSVLTSQYPRTLGIYSEYNQCLSDRFVTLAEVLQANGYTTIGVTGNPNINSVFNFNQGYDYYLDSNVVWEWMAAKAGQVQRSYSNKLKTSRETFEAGLNILRTEKKRPFFISLLVMDVHQKKQFAPRPEFSGLFSEYSRPEERQYYQMVREVSRETGDFVEKVLAMDGCRDTLFVILSDHGEGLYDYPHVENSREHGYLLYESVLRVPLIFSRPGFSLEPRVITRPVQLIDLMPTLLDYIGIEAPPDVAGHSLRPLINGESDQPELPRYFVAETYFRGSNKIAVYSAKWEYIENRDGQVGCHPHELQRNRSRQDGSLTDVLPQYRRVTQALKKYLDEWEKKHPRVKPTPCQDKEAMSKTLEQLKSLGYIK